MKLIDPSVTIITEQDPLKRIELCGRVCYKSEGRITATSAEPFVRKLCTRGHTSVLEHARICVPFATMDQLYLNVMPRRLPYGFTYRYTESQDSCVLNVRDYMAMGGSIDLLVEQKYPNADDYMTAHFVLDIGAGRQLTRHREASFSQESTRYVNYGTGVTFIRPIPFAWATDIASQKFCIWASAMAFAEKQYISAIDSGMPPEEARGVLPLAAKSELIISATHKQWEHLMDIRSESGVQPQTKYLMKLLREQMEAQK